MSAALPPHFDDHGMRTLSWRAAHGRNGNRIGNSPTARLRHGWRIARLTISHALYDPDSLHIHGSAQRMDARPAFARRDSCAAEKSRQPRASTAINRERDVRSLLGHTPIRTSESKGHSFKRMHKSSTV